MIMINHNLILKTAGSTDVVDLTPLVAANLAEQKVITGSVFLFIPGSTAALTTIEYEHGVIRDLRDAIERIAPQGIRYRHDERWGDGNGHAHVRAALLGPSLTVPVIEGRLALGTWQQIVLVDFDNRPRDRRVLLQIIGERVR